MAAKHYIPRKLAALSEQQGVTSPFVRLLEPEPGTIAMRTDRPET
jgi:hypothetical protein